MINKYHQAEEKVCKSLKTVCILNVIIWTIVKTCLKKVMQINCILFLCAQGCNFQRTINKLYTVIKTSADDVDSSSNHPSLFILLLCTSGSCRSLSINDDFFFCHAYLWKPSCCLSSLTPIIGSLSWLY